MLEFKSHYTCKALEVIKCEERAIVGKWPPLLVTSPHGLIWWMKKHQSGDVRLAYNRNPLNQNSWLRF